MDEHRSAVKDLPNVEVRVGKPADNSKVKSRGALWFASFHLISAEANPNYGI